VKKNGRKYMIELEGPDPASGEWVPHEDQGDAQTSWRWVPEEEKATPEAKRGDGWVAEGDKPQFQEASSKWQFASEKPELAYRKNGKKVAKKVAVNAAGEVTVAADSPKAEANIKKAKATGEKKKEREARKIAEAREKEKKAKAEAAEAGVKKENKEEAARPKKESAAKEKPQKTALSPSAAEPGAEAAEAEGAPEAEDESHAEKNPEKNVVSLKEKREQKEKKAALSPLEFLKRKKEKKLAGSTEEPAEGEGNEVKRREPIEGIAGEPPKAHESPAENGSIGETPEPRDRRKKSADPLDRFKNLLNEELPEVPGEEAAAAPMESPPTKTADENPEAEEASAGSPGNGKKAKPREMGAAPSAEEGKPARQPEIAAAQGKSSREKKREVIQEIQGILSAPLPEELPPAEEARLRKKFNLESAGEIGAKDLARRERKAKIDALKQSILGEELPPLAEETALTDPERHDLRAEEAENTWSRKGNASVTTPRRRAFDSELEAAEEERGGRARGEAKEPARKKDRGGADDPYRYLPESGIAPKGNAWERAGEYYVYLGGEVRYRGFNTLESLLPLWVYRGDGAPELLDKSKQWRFLARLPLEIKATGDLPKDVKDFLYGLKRAAAAAREEAEGKAEEAIEEITAEAGEAKRETEDSGGEPPSRPPRGGKEQTSDKISALYESFEKDAKALRGGQDESPLDEAGNGERPATQADTLEEIFNPEKERRAAASPADAAREKVKESSPAIEAFLERRKKKERRNSPSPPEKAEPKNPYLGIYVALSNSYNPSKDGLRSVARVLRAIEISFGRCACALLDVAGEDGLATVLLGSGEIAEGSRIAVSSAYPIRRAEAEAPMGYLLLRPTGGREGFTDEERANTEKAIAALWPAVASGRRAA
jgi:hypothetical protein